MSKILGVSFEPWETEIMSSLLYQYKKKNVFEVSQLIADTYQFDYNKNFDAKVLKSPIQIFTLKDLHNKWQTQLNQKRLKKRYNHWKKKLRKSRSVEELINSEMVFNHYERYPFYSKLYRDSSIESKRVIDMMISSLYHLSHLNISETVKQQDRRLFSRWSEYLEEYLLEE